MWYVSEALWLDCIWIARDLYLAFFLLPTLLLKNFRSVGKVKEQFRDFPGGPVVKTSPSNAEGLIPGWGGKIPHASRLRNQNIKQKQYCNKFNKDVKNGPCQKKFFKGRKNISTHFCRLHLHSQLAFCCTCFISLCVLILIFVRLLWSFRYDTP